jgi:phosphoglycolate phosphatase-like HAD superfamily hydrolase
VAARPARSVADDEATAIDRRAGWIFEDLNTDPEPLPGAVALLTALTWSRFPWAIATSGREAESAASIDALGLSARPTIIDASQVAHAKPAPDALLVAAERLGSPAYRTWSVGATTWDILAARAAGMTAVGVTTGPARREALQATGARAVIDSLHELHEELERRELVAGGA